MSNSKTFYVRVESHDGTRSHTEFVQADTQTQAEDTVYDSVSHNFRGGAVLRSCEVIEEGFYQVLKFGATEFVAIKAHYGNICYLNMNENKRFEYEDMKDPQDSDYNLNSNVERIARALWFAEQYPVQYNTNRARFKN